MPSPPGRAITRKETVTDYFTYTVADRLEHRRAAALDRENEMLRSMADRGVGVAPARPVVETLHALGVWFRARPRVLHLRVAQ